MGFPASDLDEHFELKHIQSVNFDIQKRILNNETPKRVPKHVSIIKNKVAQLESLK